MTDLLYQEPARREAVAVTTDPQGETRIIAKGYGALAEQIIAAARDHDIPVHDSPELVGLLLQLDVDQRVSPETYRVMAELLLWLEDVADQAVP